MDTPTLEELWSQVERRFGVRPAFLQHARHDASIAWGLFRFAEHAYLDNPIPSLLKEILFVYLARLCDERYALVRHCAFLVGRGHVAGDPQCPPLAMEQVVALLESPLPSESELPVWLQRLELLPAPLADWPEPTSEQASVMRVACAAVLMEPSEKGPWLNGLLRLLGRTRYEQLLLFLGFVRTALLWTELHPGIQFEPDVDQMLRDHPALARVLLDASPASRWKLREALRASGTHQSFLLTLSDRLRALADPREIMRAATEMLGRHLGVAMVQYVLVDAAQEGVELAAIYNDGRLPGMPEGTRFRFADSPGWGAALLAGQEVFSEDYETDPRELADGEPRELGMAAGSAVPLMKNGRLVAALATAHPERRGWTNSERELQREVAERTWAAAERAGAEAALRASEERQAFLLAFSDRMRAFDDPAQICAEACRSLAEHLRVHRVAYAEIDGDDCVIRACHADGMAPLRLGGLARELFVSAGAHTERSGEPVVSHDVASDATLTQAQHDICRAGEIAAFVCVTLVRDGSVVGALAIHSAAPRRWTDAEVQLVREVADRFWTRLERARAEAATRDLLAAATAARDAAKRAIKAKDEFLATLTHELRTPIAAILLWGKALRSGAMKPADLARAFDAILQSAESQSRLIEDLIDLSRLTSDRLRLVPKHVEIEQLTRSVVELIEPAARTKDIALEVDFTSELGSAFVDGARLHRVVWNLLSNAVKFTPRGGRVWLRARKHDGHLEIEVTDTGEGIAAEFMPRLFERFSQADTGESRRYSGLGIGLALSRSIVELQGGTIDAHSEGPQQGARFRVRIPWPSDDSPSPATGARLPLKGLTVLLVGNDALQRTLEHAGAVVVIVDSGARALAAVDHANAPHAVISDLELPDMDGYELIEQVVRRCRARSRTPLPAVAVGARARDVDRQRAIDAGFDLFLAKPVAPERLIEAVQDLRDIARAHAR